MEVTDFEREWRQALIIGIDNINVNLDKLNQHIEALTDAVIALDLNIDASLGNITHIAKEVGEVALDKKFGDSRVTGILRG